MNDASACRQTYQGDDALAGLLRKAGSQLAPSDVRSLLAGVLAAPEPAVEPDSWMGLVAADPSPALQAQLKALKAEIAAALDDGLESKWTRDRLQRFRAELEKRTLAGFIISRGDEHQGEYVAPRAQRLAWLTGFTGSAGLACVLVHGAAVFTDGRYTLQIREQVDTDLFETRHITEQPAGDWLAEHVKPGERIGFDPRLATPDSIARLRAGIERAGGSLVPVDDNPVDAVWTGQRPPPLSPVVPHAETFAGKSHAEKRAELAARLKKDGYAAAVLSDPASVAWLLNVRGGDVPHTPLPLSFAIIYDDGEVELFIDPRKLTRAARDQFGNQVQALPPDQFGPALLGLGSAEFGAAAQNGQKPRVLVDSATGSVWIGSQIEAGGATVVRGTDVAALPKARKNTAELAGTRAAHRRDGAALTRFLAWFAAEAPKGRLHEVEVADRLLEFRRSGEGFRDTSFDTIAGAGPNGAIVHYRASAESSRRIAPDMLFLLDSGAQYLDGTTDVTRTLAVGTPTADQRDRFTRVLKGHIALALARFPRGTSGSQLDTLARTALWEVGLDYDHGTGHGVGSYLGVHEGPQRISKLPNSVGLEPGMIVSNEPGYYKAGAYGIRLENLIVVQELPKDAGGDAPMFGFETLTLAPFDRAVIEPALLTARERDWLDAYHARVRESLTPLLDAATAAWLARATRPIVEGPTY
ncbi:MAG TPA: aminopeptidase P family protein [Alphaproteobacteria bacterium]|nr:aminopeptidase P family protein [Alphaproteobacteria bacterium]